MSIDAAATGRTSSTRRHELDWLRVIAVALLIPFHAARVFDVFDPFYVKNAQTSSFLSWAVVAFLNIWHMPLLFVLAGAATWMALGRRSAEAYAGERFRRLFVPLVFGLLVIVPPQAYLARVVRGRGSPIGSFLQDYWRVQGNLSGYTGNWTPAHLWFIAFLFVFSVVTVPFLVRLRPRHINVCWLVYVMPLVLVLANELPATDDGPQNPWFSLSLFIAGFLLIGDDRAQRLIDRMWRPLLGVVALTTVAMILLWHSGIPEGWTDGSLQDAALSIAEATVTWVWVLGLLGAGRRFLGRDSRTLRYASEASYPVYLIHQTALVVVAWAVVGWDVGVWPKFAVIIAGTFVLSLGTYELLVRRFLIPRFLFGLKPRPRATTDTLAGKSSDLERRPTSVGTADPIEERRTA
jgi:glucan biosynthesis protein C